MSNTCWMSALINSRTCIYMYTPPALSRGKIPFATNTMFVWIVHTTRLHSLWSYCYSLSHKITSLSYFVWFCLWYQFSGIRVIFLYPPSLLHGQERDYMLVQVPMNSKISKIYGLNKPLPKHNKTRQNTNCERKTLGVTVSLKHVCNWINLASYTSIYWHALKQFKAKNP